MGATTADISKFTRDGIDIEEKSTTIRDNYPDAADASDTAQETFVNTVADAETLLAERWAILSTIDALHMSLEVNEQLDIGGAITIAPQVPSFLIVDEKTGLSKVARMRAFAYDTESESFAVEVVE